MKRRAKNTRVWSIPGFGRVQTCDDLKRLLFDSFMKKGIRDREELDLFVREILGYTVPDKTFDPLHNSPFDLLEEMFFERVKKGVVLAARGSSKTRTVSIINFLDAFFKGVEVGLVAATRDQASKGYSYLTEYIKNPFISRYVANSIKAKTEFINGGSVEIHTGTVKGMNAAHPTKLSIDEVEMIDYDVLEEGLSMTASKKGFKTRDLLISTRKKLAGTMQTLLDGADDLGFKIYRWNIFDVVERCQRLCHGDPVYGDCPAWERCQGKAHDVPGGFYPIEDFIEKARTLTDWTWDMQWLCVRPSSERLVFSDQYFLKERNIIKTEDFLKLVEAESMDKVRWERFKHYGGIDFGYNFVYNHLIYIPEKDIHILVWEYYCSKDRTLEEHASIIKSNPYCPSSVRCWKYYDPSGRQEALELEHYGVKYLCPSDNSREAGVDCLKTAFRNGKLLILEGAGKGFLKEIETYVYPTDGAGNVLSNNPEKGDDHSIDALRYAFYGNYLKLYPAEYAEFKFKRASWLR